MGMLLLYGIVLLVYFFCPKYLQLIICAVNLFVPDAAPAIDEVIMVAGLFLSDN